MKLQTIKYIFIFLVLFLYTHNLKAQQTDPVLVAAITTIATPTEKKALDEVRDTQKDISKTQSFINVQLKKINDIQQRTYKHLTNISGAVQNAHDIKKATFLLRDIMKLCGELGQAAKENPQGVITTTFATKQISEIKEEVYGIYAYVSGLTLNKEVLMNSAQRLVITTQVVYRLELIKSRLSRLVYSTYAYSFKDLPRLIFPDIYYSALSKQRIAENIIRSWNY